MCTSCNPSSGRTILYENKCYSSCPAGTWDSGDGDCLACGDKCGSCQQENPEYCLSCDTSSAYPYLIGNTCEAECQFGFYADARRGKCLECSADCETCVGSATNCARCDQNSSKKYQYNGRCYLTCPAGFTTTSTSDNECLPCDSACNTCKGAQDYCTSCSGDLFLDEANHVCTDTCPPGVTVRNRSRKVCEACDYLCSTCGGLTSFCTGCISNYFLKPDSGRCVKQCSSDNTEVPYFGTCTECDENCATCQTSPTQCISCRNNMFFYNYECVNECPEGYEVFETSRKI